MKIFLLFFIFCGFSSCNERNNQSETFPEPGFNYFSDINYYEMKGVLPMKGGKINYPCYGIQHPDSNTIHLVCIRSDKEKIHKIFKKQDSAWVNIDNGKGDTSNLTSYNYVFHDKLLSLDYTSDGWFNLMNMYSLTIFQNNMEATYVFDNPLNVLPATKVNSLINDNISRKETSRFIVEGEILKVIRINYDLQDRIQSIDSSLYNIGQHSVFWWRDFGVLNK